MMKNSVNFSGIYAISAQTDNTAFLLQQIEAALCGGVRIVQYRDKSANPTLRLAQAQALRTLCNKYKALLLINDDPALAKACHADGVHLGQSDGLLSHARALLGDEAIIGVTCHNSLILAQQAAAQGADYLSFGCFFPSQTKPLAKPADLSMLKQAKAQFTLPIVAIGGITLAHIPTLIKAGADVLAISAGLFSGADIKQVAQALEQAFAN